MNAVKQETKPGKMEGPQGPVAMIFDDNKGWTTETLGPTTRHWKCLAREIKGKSTEVGLGQENKKRLGPTPLQELDPNVVDQKKRKGKNQRKLTLENEEDTVGGEAVAAAQPRRAQ